MSHPYLHHPYVPAFPYARIPKDRVSRADDCVRGTRPALVRRSESDMFNIQAYSVWRSYVRNMMQSAPSFGFSTWKSELPWKLTTFNVKVVCRLLVPYRSGE